MPDVGEYSFQKVAKQKALQERDPDDEITRVASKVLSDLESFVDESSDVDDLERDASDDDEETSRAIGVSLDELRLILDTSIRRHVGAEPSPRHRVGAPVEPLSPVRSKFKLRAYPRVSAPSTRSPLSELQQLLQSKQQDFARLQEGNRAAERAPRLRRDRREDEEPFHTHRDPRRHQDRKDRVHRNHQHWQERRRFPSAQKASSVSSSSSPVSSASRASHQDRVQPVNNQATETDDSWLPARPETQRAEKACNISPSDLGPAIADLPAFMALDLSGQLQSPRSDKSASHRSSRVRDDDRKSKRSQGSESGWSSSSSSSRADSSVGSESARQPTRHSHHKRRSRDGGSDTQSNYSVHHIQSQEQRIEPMITTAVAPHTTSGASEQLDWELDLSNFNI